MKSILVELTCNKCMFRTYRKSETLILSDFETQVREQLLNDTFFTFRCPCCSNTIEFIHPLAYVDKNHKFILLIKANKDFKKNDHLLYKEDVTSKKRYISNHKNIAEKIRIFEDDLDDRCIEIMKFKLNSYLEKHKHHTFHINYHDYDECSDTLWFQTCYEEDVDIVAVPMSEYKKILSDLPKERHDYYHEINKQWVLDYFIK